MGKCQAVVFDFSGYHNRSEKEKNEINEAFNDYQDAIVKEIEGLVTTLGVSYQCACDLYYSRTRNLHTQALEDELIHLQ